MTTTMTKAQLLENAKALMTRHGWRRGGGGGPISGYCLADALRAAHDQAMAGHSYITHYVPGYGRVGEPNKAAELVGASRWEANALLERLLGQGNVCAWNDSSERTAKEVFALIDRAIGLCSAGHNQKENNNE